MDFGNRLRKLRVERGLTISQLADKFNYGISSFSSYERGTRKPPIKLVSDLADFFNVSIDYMVGKTDIRKIELPKELKKFMSKYGIEYIESLKYAHEKGIPPEDIKVIIDTFEEIKPILDRLSN